MTANVGALSGEHNLYIYTLTHTHNIINNSSLKIRSQFSSHAVMHQTASMPSRPVCNGQTPLHQTTGKTVNRFPPTTTKPLALVALMWYGIEIEFIIHAAIANEQRVLLEPVYKAPSTVNVDHLVGQHSTDETVSNIWRWILQSCTQIAGQHIINGREKVPTVLYKKCTKKTLENQHRD